MPNSTSLSSAGWLLATLLAVVLVVPSVIGWQTGFGGATQLTLWISGAAALGLLTGFTTGASSQVGIGTELLKLVSSGIVVPLVGGIVTLLRAPSTTNETSTYAGEHVIQRVTVTSPSTAEFLPVGVLGGFFLAYCVFAIIGIRIGIAHREGGIEIKQTN